MSPPDMSRADRGIASVPGPVDRVTFYAEQRRNRRATWPLFLFSAIGVAVMGIPFSLVLTPFLYLVLLLSLGAGGLVRPVPDNVWKMLESVGLAVLRVVEHALDPKHTAMPDPSIVQLAERAMFLPGVVVLLLLWLMLRAMFFSAGVGGVLLTLQARAPRTGDLKEMQLVDVTEEMAIAAGVRVPRVLLLDSLAANAAVVGSSLDNATLVVSRGLLEQLHRDELQAVIAHLVASAGNGDLRMGMTIMSVFQSFGLMMTLINAPFGPRARSTLWSMVRAMFSGGSPEAEARVAQAVQMLANAAEIDSSSDLDDRMRSSEKKTGTLETIRGGVLVPFAMLNFTLRFIVWVFSTALVKPALALLWRTRRYLADATAVQLTRNPDGLARALERLAESGQMLAADPWTSLLFMVGPEAGRTGSNQIIRHMQEIQAREAAQGRQVDHANLLHAAVQELSAGKPTDKPDLRPELRKALETMLASRAASGELVTLQDVIEARRRAHPAGDAPASSWSGEGGLLSFHPSLQRRRQRLRRMGASVDPESLREFHSAWRSWFMAALATLVFPLLAVGLVLCIGLSLLFMGAMLGFVVMLFKIASLLLGSAH